MQSRSVAIGDSDGPRTHGQGDSVPQRLPSSQKLYTLRGVSAVYLTVTSIRNLRTPPSWRYSFGPGKRGWYAV